MNFKIEKKECGVSSDLAVSYKIVATDNDSEVGFFLHIYDSTGNEITEEVESSLDGPFMSTGDAKRFIEDRFENYTYLGFVDERNDEYLKEQN
jgi:hypothetical protein